MKHLVISAFLLCMVILSFGQEGKKSKDYPRFLKEEAKITRSNAGEALGKNLEMKAEDELKPEKSEKDQLGFIHDKYQQYYKKIKVEGAVYSVHSRNDLV